MKAIELRQSFLQAAVQGKLVPQCVHDEPASELLKRIQAYKSRLIKEGKLKKEKNLPPITKNEIPYDLPEGWVWCRLGDVAVINPRNNLPGDTNVSFVPMASISSEYFGGHDQEVRVWDKVKSNFTHFAEGDVALAKITPCFQNGKSCLISNLCNGYGAGTTELHIIRCISLVPKYMLVYLKTPKFLAEGVINMTGTAGQQRVPTEYIKKCLFPLSPFAEQQRIVAKVDELMALCDELETAEYEMDALESHFTEYLPKSILQAAVQGKLVPQNIHDEPASVLLKRICAEKARFVKKGKLKKEKLLLPITEDEIPYDLPEGWVWCRLGNVIQLGENLNIHKELPAGTIINYVDIDAVDNFKYCIRSSKQEAVENLSSRARRVLKKGYILYSLVRPYLNNIAIIEEDMENYIGSTGFVVFRPYYMPLGYFVTLLLSDYINNHFKSLLSGFNSPSVSQGDFLSTPFPLPPLAEQKRIVAKVGELMALCDELKNTKTQPIEKSDKVPQNIVDFPRVKLEESLQLAARGEISEKPSVEFMQAVDDMFKGDV